LQENTKDDGGLVGDTRKANIIMINKPRQQEQQALGFDKIIKREKRNDG